MRVEGEWSGGQHTVKTENEEAGAHHRVAEKEVARSGRGPA